jgi:hypothetical protein
VHTDSAIATSLKNSTTGDDTSIEEIFPSDNKSEIFP